MKLSTSSMSTGRLEDAAPENVADVNGFGVAFAGFACAGADEDAGVIEKA